MSNSEYREIKLRDGRVLAFAEYGNANGQPIIHCHGAPSSRVEGDVILNPGTLDELGLRIIVPDRPGMGRSDFQPGRRIIDWPNDVLELAEALQLDTFIVVGESGGAPYAAACGALFPTRVRALGLIGGVAPFDAPGVLDSLSGPLKLMFRLARSAPPILRGLLRLNLSAIRGGGERGNEQMAASFPEPDRSLMRRPEIRSRFIACFAEACRKGTDGPAWDMGLIARPWEFDLAKISIPVLLWQGERDGNVPPVHGRYLASAIPNCRAMFYPEEAHFSLPLNRQREILSALAAVSA